MSGPCSFFRDRDCTGGHIYGDKDQDDHCQLCGQPKPRQVIWNELARYASEHAPQIPYGGPRCPKEAEKQ